MAARIPRNRRHGPRWRRRAVWSAASRTRSPTRNRAVTSAIAIVVVAVPVAASPALPHPIPASPSAVLVTVRLVVALGLVVAATIVGFPVITHAAACDGASADKPERRRQQQPT